MGILLAPLESCDQTVIAVALSCSGRRLWRPDKMEEAPKICGSGGGEFFRRQVSHIRKRARYFRDVGGLIAFAAVGWRREEGSVGFDENAVKRDVFCDVADVLGLRISRITGEGNHEASVKSAARFLNRTGETMQDAADSCGAPDLFNEREAIGPGVATVDDDGEFGVAGECHLVAEYLMLDVARGVIVKIIQSNFAPGDYFRMFCKLSEFFEVLRCDLLRFVRMDSDGGVYPVILIRVWQRGV